MNDCIQFEGAVDKTSGIFKNKSKIWLVLENHSLNFYKNKMKDSCIDSIEIADIQTVRQTGNKGGEEFQISTAHKSYTFVAAAFELAEAWVCVIQKVMSIRSIPRIDDDTSHVPNSPSTPVSRTSSVFEELGQLSSHRHNSIFGVRLKRACLSRSSVTSSTSPEPICTSQFSYEPSGFNKNNDTNNRKTTEQDRKAKIVPTKTFKLHRPPPSFNPPPPPTSRSDNTNMNLTSHPKEYTTISPQSPSHRDDPNKPRKSQYEGDNIIVGPKSPPPPGDNTRMKPHSPRPTDDASNSQTPPPNENTYDISIEQTSPEDNACTDTQDGHILVRNVCNMEIKFEAVTTPILTDTIKRPTDKTIESVDNASNSVNKRVICNDLQEADAYKSDSASRSKSPSLSLKKSNVVEDHHDRDMVCNEADVDISAVRMRKSQTISQNVKLNDVDVSISHVVMRKSSRSTMNTEWNKDTDEEPIDDSTVMKTETKDISGANEIDSTNVNYDDGKSQVMIRKSSRSRNTSNNHQSFNTENGTSSIVYTDNDIRDDDITAPAYETKYLRYDSNVNEDEGDNESLFDEEVFQSIFALEEDQESPLRSRMEDRLHVKYDAFNKLKHYIDTQCEGGFDIVSHRISTKRPFEVLRNVLCAQ